MHFNTATILAFLYFTTYSVAASPIKQFQLDGQIFSRDFDNQLQSRGGHGKGRKKDIPGPDEVHSALQTSGPHGNSPEHARSPSSSSYGMDPFSDLGLSRSNSGDGGHNEPSHDHDRPFEPRPPRFRAGAVYIHSQGHSSTPQKKASLPSEISQRTVKVMRSMKSLPDMFKRAGGEGSSEAPPMPKIKKQKSNANALNDRFTGKSGGEGSSSGLLAPPKPELKTKSSWQSMASKFKLGRKKDDSEDKSR